MMKMRMMIRKKAMTGDQSRHFIRILLPHHLRTLAQITGELVLEVAPAVTVNSILDAVEAKFPQLKGTIRDHSTRKRRDFVRFFACEEDLSNDNPDEPLPEAIVSGRQPFYIVGAIAGG